MSTTLCASAQIRVRAWITIHLCSNEELVVSKIFKNISLKKTCNIETLDKHRQLARSIQIDRNQRTRSDALRHVPRFVSLDEFWNATTKPRIWPKTVRTLRVQARRHYWITLCKDSFWWPKWKRDLFETPDPDFVESTTADADSVFWNAVRATCTEKFKIWGLLKNIHVR